MNEVPRIKPIVIEISYVQIGIVTEPRMRTAWPDMRIQSWYATGFIHSQYHLVGSTLIKVYRITEHIAIDPVFYHCIVVGFILPEVCLAYFCLQPRIPVIPPVYDAIHLGRCKV